MAWIKVPAENHPIFFAALPKDPRVETMKMFGGVAAKVNGHLFAGLFGRSTMLLLAEPDRATALALEGASLFDPMGDGRARSDKVMLPERMMASPAELRGWIARAFKAASMLPKKEAKAARAGRAGKQAATEKRTVKVQDRPKRRTTRQVVQGPSTARLARILTSLEEHFGGVQTSKPARPYDLLLYTNCGYPASERACDAGFAALKTSIGISPQSILRASKGRLVAAMRAGGIVPELRAERLREIARQSTNGSDANPDLIVKLPLAKARRLLKTFPTIGDPGADKILLFSHTEPIAAVPSNATQVPLRLGFGKEQASYAAGYRSAQAALDAALPRTVTARLRAYLLIKKLGEDICKRSRPQCERCPVASDCPFPGKPIASPSVSRIRRMRRWQRSIR